MIKPNFELLMWFLWFYLIFSGVIEILGSVVLYGEKKESYWDLGDTIIGLILLLIAFLVMVL